MKKTVWISITILCVIAVLVAILVKNVGKEQEVTTAKTTVSTTTTTTTEEDTTTITTTRIETTTNVIETTTQKDRLQYQKEKYYEILDLYYDVLTDKVEIKIDNNSVCYLCMPYFRGEKPLENIGYKIIDLNNDGNLELIIGGTPTNEYWPDMIFALYTFANGEPKLIVESAERSRNYLCDDNYISNEGSSGAAYSVYYLYKFKGTKLSVVEYLYSDGDNEQSYVENNLSPWYLSNSGEQNPKNDKHLTEDEAELKIKGYRDRRIPLGLKPFKTYK